jgi:NADH-quinone oxidoreductase subunit N
MASGVKVAGFAGLLRVLYLGFDAYRIDWQPIVYALAVVSLLAGALLAIVQTDVKRMLAYSSISHAGFILVAVQSGTDRGVEAAMFYLAAYTFMVAGTFGVVTLLGRVGDIGHSLDDYRGLSRTRPVLALGFAVFLFAQAGVPLTSGFFAKFFVITAAVDAGSMPLAVVAMISAVVAAFLYLRIIVSLYLGDPEEAPAISRVPVPFAAGLALVVALGFTLAAGVSPAWLADLAGDAVPVLVAAP